MLSCEVTAAAPAAGGEEGTGFDDPTIAAAAAERIISSNVERYGRCGILKNTMNPNPHGVKRGRLGP